MLLASLYKYIGAPPVPIDLLVIPLNKEDTTLLTVNLTWFQKSMHSNYVVVYYVEVTAININITNMTSSISQYIVLPLKIGVVYSFRVRGANRINRLGEWSSSLIYPGI